VSYCLTTSGVNELFQKLNDNYRIFAPKCFVQGGKFSDTDCIRYGEIQSVEEIVFDKKSSFSFKEVIFPISQTLFYFTEDTVTEPAVPAKDAIVFLRSCDVHGLRRMDHIYLENGPEDSYYKYLREHTYFVLMGCREAFDSCFCVDMGTNQTDAYDFSLDPSTDGWKLDVRNERFRDIIASFAQGTAEEGPDFVSSTKTKVCIPEHLTADVAKSSIWKEYDGRCINCGRCNFVCPTCTCFTMQDMFYSENGKVGERRRVWASCMVDGFTDVAGGGSYRKGNGERMRFKVLHKALDYKERNGYQMCVGCGRCDDVCPEYISFSHCLNRLSDAMKEVESHE
jgi:anaerobic sulfite reductase subunit A